MRWVLHCIGYGQTRVRAWQRESSQTVTHVCSADLEAEADPNRHDQSHDPWLRLRERRHASAWNGLPFLLTTTMASCRSWARSGFAPSR